MCNAITSMRINPHQIVKKSPFWAHFRHIFEALLYLTTWSMRGRWWKVYRLRVDWWWLMVQRPGWAEDVRLMREAWATSSTKLSRCKDLSCSTRSQKISENSPAVGRQEVFKAARHLFGNTLRSACKLGVDPTRGVGSRNTVQFNPLSKRKTR